MGLLKNWVDIGVGKGLCGNECESISHVLWGCPIYSSSRADFLF